MKTTHSFRQRNRMRLFLFGLFLMAVATGCATTDQIYTTTNEVTTLSKGKGRIMFYRTGTFIGGAMKTDILLDGRKVGESSSGTVFFVDIAPGKHKVQASAVRYTGEQPGDIEVRQNETIYVKTYVGDSAFAGRTGFKVVSAEQAKADGIDNLVFMVFMAEPPK